MITPEFSPPSSLKTAACSGGSVINARVPDHSLVYVAELIHRINNEYSTVISLASSVAARAYVPEVRAALQPILDRLHAYARVHCVMRPSVSTAPMDLGEHMAQVCAAMASAALQGRDVSLHLVRSQPIVLDEGRCWRVGLILAELITNAARHAFNSGGGSITVELTKDDQLIVCSVIDDGSSNREFEPGLGTSLVVALAAELGGTVRRQPEPYGTAVWLSFPSLAGPRRT